MGLVGVDGQHANLAETVITLAAGLQTRVVSVVVALQIHLLRRAGLVRLARALRSNLVSGRCWLKVRIRTDSMPLCCIARKPFLFEKPEHTAFVEVEFLLVDVAAAVGPR